MAKDKPDATVRRVGDKLVLDDPVAEAVMGVVDRHNRSVAYANCDITYRENADRVRHFIGRMDARGLSPDDVVILIASPDDVNGKAILDVVMPGFDFGPIRATGARPYGRGLVTREAMQELVRAVDANEGRRMSDMRGDVVVLVVDFGVVRVFSAEDQS